MSFISTRLTCALNRLLRDDQVGGDLGVGHAAGDQAQHLGLALGQTVEVLAAGGPRRAQAGAVPFPEHDDVRPEKQGDPRVGWQTSITSASTQSGPASGGIASASVSRPRRAPCQRRQSLSNLAARAGLAHGDHREIRLRPGSPGG